MTWSAWVNLIVGLLLIVSPFVLGFSSNATATWTAVIAGVVVALVSALQALAEGRKPATRGNMNQHDEMS